MFSCSKNVSELTPFIDQKWLRKSINTLDDNVPKVNQQWIRVSGIGQENLVIQFTKNKDQLNVRGKSGGQYSGYNPLIRV